MQKKTSTSFLRRYVLSNIVAKAMALAMALALWLYAYNFSLARNKTFDLPVLVKAAEGWNVSSVEPQAVKITLRCPRRFEARVDQIMEAAKIRCEASANENGLDQQQVSVLVEQSQMGIPADMGTAVDMFEPTHVQVMLVREEERRLSVKLNLSDPPSGWEVVQQPQVLPAMVRVRGPKDVISNVEFVETNQIDISFPPPSFAREWSLPDYMVELVPYVTLNETEHPVTFVGKTQVRCRIRLAQITSELEFEDVPIGLHVPPDYPYIVQIDEAQRTTSVKVTGPARLVEMLKPENIDLYIKVGGIEPDELKRYPPIHANIVGMQNARELVIAKLGISECAVKVMQPDKE